MNRAKDYLGKMLPGENAFTSGNERWDLSTLIEASEGLPTFELNLMSLNLEAMPWRFERWNYDSFLFHYKRCEEVDRSYPIIVGPTGYILDGWHRIAKAIMNGDETISAIRLKVMPTADQTDIDNGE